MNWCSSSTEFHQDHSKNVSLENFCSYYWRTLCSMIYFKRNCLIIALTRNCWLELSIPLQCKQVKKQSTNPLYFQSFSGVPEISPHFCNTEFHQNQEHTLIKYPLNDVNGYSCFKSHINDSKVLSILNFCFKSRQCSHARKLSSVCICMCVDIRVCDHSYALAKVWCYPQKQYEVPYLTQDTRQGFTSSGLGLGFTNDLWHIIPLSFSFPCSTYSFRFIPMIKSSVQK